MWFAILSAQAMGETTCGEMGFGEEGKFGEQGERAREEEEGD